jgi:hypothetical protein
VDLRPAFWQGVWRGLSQLEEQLRSLVAASTLIE